MGAGHSRLVIMIINHLYGVDWDWCTYTNPSIEEIKEFEIIRLNKLYLEADQTIPSTHNLLAQVNRILIALFPGI